MTISPTRADWAAAPPATGENDLSVKDGLYHCDTVLHELPQIRIRFAPVEA
ncbi:MAG: hypothetical protein V8T34_01510 [Ruminococcus callidus]